MTQTNNTLLDVLTGQLRNAATAFYSEVEEAPCAVLWTDQEEGWKPLLSTLKQRLPELLVLGDYDPANRQGPAIWLKAAMAGKIPEIELPAEKVPILYLPGVARHQLRQADQCPWELQPLVELLFRGTAWGHRNGKDWTVEGFFMSNEGLGLDLSRDEKTRLSLHASLEVLADIDITRLQGKRLEGADFDALVVGDTPRDLLTWIEHDQAVKSEWGSERWHAFRSRCQDEYGFDPNAKSPLYAAEKLGLRDGSQWQMVWERYCEAPDVYGGIKAKLDQAQPADQLALDAQAWPRENAEREKRLGQDLEKLESIAAHDARHRIAELEKEHGERRSWVWAKQGDSPLAAALASLSCLAESTLSLPSFSKLDEFRQWYTESGIPADAAALAAFRDAGPDETPVRKAIRAVYLPWLNEICEKFQVLLKENVEPELGISPGEGECILFVDGLRLDLGHELVTALETYNLSPRLETRLAALPTVTATAKPAVSPLSHTLSGESVPADFAPNGPDGKSLTHARFMKQLAECGVERVSMENPAPSSPTAKGWAEAGKIDSRGHDLEAELAKHLPDELNRVVTVIRRLLEAGWRKVTVVTDHGWLWMPGGLPKKDLPGFLVESRWSRCAAIKGQSVPDVPVVPWRWNGHESVAVAPGAACFKAGMEYAHGGVSPQECILPVIYLEGDKDGFTTKASKISSVRWKRLRCNVEVKDVVPGLQADLRNGEAVASISLVNGPKDVEADGLVSWLVPDEDLEGQPAWVVLLNAAGEIISKQSTTVGG